MIRHPFLRRFAEHRGGLALVEFAMVLPFLLLLYLAGYQVSDALSCNRKVTITTRAVADLTTQYSAITDDGITDILNASTKIMAPYNAANAMVRVSELSTDATGKTTVVWSRIATGVGRAAGSSYTLPATIKTNGTNMIVAEVSYAYKPAVNFGIVGPLNLSDVIYMNPRVSNSVDKT